MGARAGTQADGPWAALAGRGRQPLLLVLSGPSGAGKSSLIKGFLAARSDFVDSISATTRPPRSGERDGVDYHFIDEERFRSQIGEGAFLEYAQVFGRHYYGTPRAFIDARFAEGRSVVMDIDVQGAAQIRSRMPEAVLVFVMPPSRQELERRLVGRGTEDADSLSRRLAEADRELARWRDYHYLVINDDLDHAVQRLSIIVEAERMHVTR